MSLIDDLKKELIYTGKFLTDKDLAWGNAGNISARLDDESFVITASGTVLGSLEKEDLLECSFSGDNVQVDGRKPSKETPMHQAIYEERPEIGAVLHAAPFYSTLVSCSSLDVRSDLFVETMYYLEKVERIPYHHPGSMDLANALREKAKSANVFLLENHGIVVCDSTIKEARVALEVLELACKMMITAQNNNVSLPGIPENVVKDFLENAGYKQRRKWN